MMLEHAFVSSIAVLLIAGACGAARVGLILFGAALLTCMGILLSTSAFAPALAETMPPESLARSIVLWSVVVCIEDSARTWFVTRAVHKKTAVGVASLAFAIALTFVEVGIQISDAILSAMDRAFGIGVDYYPEDFDALFSSPSETFAVVGMYAIRPATHLLLSLALYYSWKIKSKVYVILLVSSHIFVDIAIEQVLQRNSLDFAKVFGIISIFTLLLYPSMLWIRAAATRQAGGTNRGDSTCS